LPRLRAPRSPALAPNSLIFFAHFGEARRVREPRRSPESGRPAGFVEALEREFPGERPADLRVGEVGPIRISERALEALPPQESAHSTCKACSVSFIES
jgi:hypothetical protein